MKNAADVESADPLKEVRDFMDDLLAHGAIYGYELGEVHGGTVECRFTPVQPLKCVRFTQKVAP